MIWIITAFFIGGILGYTLACFMFAASDYGREDEN